MARSVIITGTRSGLGKALAEVFKDKGWEVIATSKEATDFPLDVSDQESLGNLAKKVEGKPIDLLINNAALYDADSADDDNVISDVENITNVFKVNSIGPRVLTEKLIQNLMSGEMKLVVTISSGMGTHAKLNDYSAQHWPYSASKAAVNFEMVSLTRLYPKLKSVLIYPGWLKTKIGGTDATVEPEESAAKIFELIGNHKNKLPNGRLTSFTGELMEF